MRAMQLSDNQRYWVIFMHKYCEQNDRPFAAQLYREIITNGWYEEIHREILNGDVAGYKDAYIEYKRSGEV
jgi:hypothetical protein